MKLSRISLSIILVPLIFAASASIALADENIDSQIQHYTQELKAKPKSVDLLIKRGDLYFKTHQFDKAVADFSAAIRLDGHADKAYFGRGLALGRNGNVRQGIKDLSVYIGRHPTDSYGYTKRGIRYLWLGDDSSAEKDLSMAIKLNPKNAEAHDDLGVVYGRRGDYKTAFKNFLACVTIDPTYFKGWHNLAMAYYVFGEDKPALAAIDRSLALVPDQRSSMLLKATILHAMGREKEAAQVKEDAEWLPVGNSSENIPIQ
ncbi:MAG: tetratricopeptide repeat protein [Acidiferrobacteraceae bacterium]|jgi:tetratricopeptide (TPR) repeat protein